MAQRGYTDSGPLDSGPSRGAAVQRVAGSVPVRFRLMLSCARDREGREAVRLLADPAAARAFLRRDLPLWAWPLCTLGPREWPYVRLWVEPEDGPEATAPRQPGLWIFDHPSWGGGVQAFGEAAALDGCCGA